MAGRTGRRVYKSRRWQAVRRRVFARDGWRCVLCGRRSALECDHVRPIEQSGDWFDLENLRTLCRSCHIQVTREANCKPVSPERAALMDLAYAR